MKIDDIASLLANKINQPHYIKYWLEKVASNAYEKGINDAKKQESSIFFCECIEEFDLHRPLGGTDEYCTNCGLKHNAS